MKKRVIIAVTAAALFAGGLQAKSRDPGLSDKRQIALGEFDSIAVGGPFLVRVRTGKSTNVSLAGPRTMLDDTELFIRNGQLIIRWQEGASWSRNGDHGVDIDITVPVLRGATMAGAGSIEIDHVKADAFAAMLLSAGGITVRSLDVNQFKAQLAGSGSLALGRIEAKTVEVDLVGSGEMRAKGRAGTATLRLASSGSFNNPSFAAENADIVAAGSGVIRAMVTNRADIQSIGSGDVELTGGAKCSVSKQGSGNVRCS